MTIKDTVKAVITTLPGNKMLTTAEISTYCNGNGDVGALTNDQISKALRSLSNVVSAGRGKYRIKGRRVYP